MKWLDRLRGRDESPAESHKEYVGYCVTCMQSYGGTVMRFCMFCGKRLVWAERLDDKRLVLTDQEVQ